jgi:hypothetical protein
MPGIVEFPNVVQHALEDYGDLFASEPQRRHFGEYLTGLMLAERKTVLGIHREFADIADQSCLNRFLTEVDWDVEALNERRLELLQQQSETRWTDRGVIPIDNVLIDHDGKRIADVGWFWDHAEQRHKIAQDVLIVNYVCSSGRHYPLDFRRFQKRDQCEDRGQPFVNHTQLCCQLIDWVVQHDIPGTFTFDSYFTNAEILNHIHTQKDRHGDPRAYVGDLKFNRKLESKGRIIKAEELAATIPPEQKQELRRGDERQWTYTCTVHIPDVDHKVRILFIWNHRRDTEPKKTLVTNRTTWETTRIVLAYRERWTGTETFHRDGKQQLGLGDCQLRSGQGQTRHMYLVFLAYTLLMCELRQSRAKDWALQRLTTIGEACRALLCESLRATLEWAIAQVTEQDETPKHVMVRLGIG